MMQEPTMIVRDAEVLEAAGIGIVVRAASGIVVHQNRAAQRLLDADDGDFTEGRRRVIHTDGSLCAPDEFPLSRSLHTETTIRDVELGIEQRDGGFRWLRITSSPYEIGSDGMVMSTITLLYDVSGEVANRTSSQRVADAGRVVVTVHDSRGDVVHASANSVDVIGRRARDLLGTRLWEACHPSDRSRLAELVEALTAGAAPTARARLGLAASERHRSAPLDRVDLRSQPDRRSGPSDRRSSGHHRGPRRTATTRRCRYRQRASVAGSPVPTKSLDASGTILGVNAAFARLVGRPVGALIGHSWQEFAHPAEVAVEQRIIAELAIGLRETAVFERRFARPDGTWSIGIHHLHAVRDTDGRLIEIRARTVDITETRTVQQELQENRAWLQAIVESTSDGIVAIRRTAGSSSSPTVPRNCSATAAAT
ncbi:MAG: PAS domain-containing protein [Ilumatobacteraceae bacterium]